MTEPGSGVEAPRGVPFDPEAAIERISAWIITQVGELGRRGVVVAVSGGIDSSAVAGLCIRAVGPKRVILLRLPEKDAGDSSSDLGLLLAESLGARTVEEPITDALAALGCYSARDGAIKKVFADYEPDWRHKVVRSPPAGGITFFSLVVERPDGSSETRRIPPAAYLELIAATNIKQRARKLTEYTWADRLSYVVAGTPNLLEYDQGFFVKGGDGLADIKPISRLYKSQVYAVAEALGLPAEITSRQPTTDTFSLPQTQEEFYFGHPYERMDLLMWGERNALPAAELAPRVELGPDEVEEAYAEIRHRRVATAYLHASAILPPDGG
jgi:NAD+ synthase